MKYKIIIAVLGICTIFTACGNQNVSDNSGGGSAENEVATEAQVQETPEEIEKREYLDKVHKVDNITSEFYDEAEIWEKLYADGRGSKQDAEKTAENLKKIIDGYDEIINIEHIPENYVQLHNTAASKIEEMKNSMYEYADNIVKVAEGSIEAGKIDEIKENVGKKIAEMGESVNNIYSQI